MFTRADEHLRATPLIDVVAEDLALDRWNLGFKQSSFHRIARVLRDSPLHVFAVLPAFPTCCFPFRLSLPVGRVTRGLSPVPSPPVVGF
jgi:hypothetical protein